jgi:hypothetical protein
LRGTAQSKMCISGGTTRARVMTGGPSWRRFVYLEIIPSGRSITITGASKMISADGPDALRTRRDTTTLTTPGAASPRDPDVSSQNGPPANDDT